MNYDNLEIRKVYEISFIGYFPKRLSTTNSLIIVSEEKIIAILLTKNEDLGFKFLFKNNIVYLCKEWIKNNCKKITLLNP